MNDTLFADLEISAAPAVVREQPARAPKRAARIEAVQDVLFAEDMSGPATARSFAEIVIANALARLDKPTDSAMKALFAEDIPAIAKAVPAEAFEGFIRRVAKEIHADYRADFAWTIKAWGLLASGSLRDVAVSLAHDPESSISAWMNSKHWLNGDAALCAEFSTSADSAKRRAFGSAMYSNCMDHVFALRPECIEELANDTDKHLARTVRFAAVRVAGFAKDGTLPASLLPRMETIIAKSAEHCRQHAEWNLEGRFIAGEAAIAADWQTASGYAADILGIKADDTDELFAGFAAVTGHTVKSPFGTKEARELSFIFRNAVAIGHQRIAAGELPEECAAKLECVHSSKFDAVALASTVALPSAATEAQKEEAFLAALLGSAEVADDDEGQGESKDESDDEEFDDDSGE